MTQLVSQELSRLDQDLKRVQVALRTLDSFDQLIGRQKVHSKIICISGMQELGQGKQRMGAVFQGSSSSSSANKDVFDVMALTKAYHKYKRDYVKQKKKKT